MRVPMVAFDVVQRWLKASGLRVTYVRNITDIEDKIIRRAVKTANPSRPDRSHDCAKCTEDFDALGIQRPDHDPRATDYVPQMLALIVKLLQDKGLAYQHAGGDVNYAVRKFPGYGKLSGKSLDELHAGERVAVLEGKDDPAGFCALEEPPNPPNPPTPSGTARWGEGRPGWHIECSAMACATAGARALTSTVAALICSFPTMRMKSPRAKAPTASRWRKLLDAQRLHQRGQREDGTL
jgi:cysteinyl-tRNA synthetase